jgi:hypothetical protein
MDAVRVAHGPVRFGMQAQPAPGHLTLRDGPAIRDIDGKPFTREYPFASDRNTKERIIANQVPSASATSTASTL